MALNERGHQTLVVTLTCALATYLALAMDTAT